MCGICPHSFEYTNNITYSIREQVNSADKIKHPAIREAMKFLEMHDVSLTYDADLPARIGLGTSSSFAMALLMGFYTLKTIWPSVAWLRKVSIWSGSSARRSVGGLQDQIAAAYGGFNRIDFSTDGFQVNPVVISNGRKEQLNVNLLLFFTGLSRFSAQIQEKHEQAIHLKEQQLLAMLALVDQAEAALVSGGLDEFGLLLDYTWQLKRGVNAAVSNDTIDSIYAAAKQAGALGGKLLGAGGGVFCYSMCRRTSSPACERHSHS